MSKFGADRRNPRSRGQCDRGDHVVYHDELQREMVMTPDGLRWNGFLVCARHIDKPHPQDGRRRLFQDPVPIKNPRPEK